MKNNFKKLFAAVLIMFSAAGCNLIGSASTLGVLKTLDGGGSWQPADFVNQKTNISGLVVSELQFDPSDRQTVYLAAQNYGMWISKDSAATWNQILGRITLYDFFVNPNNSKNILAVGIYNDHGKIVRSNDGGSSWEEVYNEASVKNSVNTITANPSNPSELYAGLNSGVFIKSQDGGVNWFVVNDFKDQILKARYNRANNSIYTLTRTKGLYKSTNGGVNWTQITSSLTSGNFLQGFAGSQIVPSSVSSFTKMGLDSTSPGVIYITTSDGLFKTVDDGKNWSFVFLPIKKSALLPRAIASVNGGMIAYTSIGSTIYKTLNGGQSWQTQQLPTSSFVNSIIIDPVLQQIAYAGIGK